MSASRTGGYPGIKETSFEADGICLNYAEGPPNGPPLVLLHGVGRHWQTALPLMATLALRWQVFALDFRGHGHSSRVPGKYRVIDYAADLAAFLRDQVRQPAVLFGHSLGGMVTMHVAAHHPQMVRAVVLGDNPITLRKHKSSMYADLFGGLLRLGSSGGTIEELACGIAEIQVRTPNSDARTRIADLPGNDQAYLFSWARCLSQVDPEVFRMTLDGSSREGWDGEECLHRMTCPTLLLQANPKLGALMSDDDVELAVKTLAHSVYVRLDDHSHALHMQKSEPVLRAVMHFLEGLGDED